jgi:hypothetical protein
MRALTLWQPWAHIVASGLKRIENRRWWRKNVRGERIAIHAGKCFDAEAADRIYYEFGGPLLTNHRVELGAVIATAVVASVVDNARDAAALAGDDQARWFFGPFGWVLEDIVACDPLPCRGRQGLWRLPDDVETAVKASSSADSGVFRRSDRDTDAQNPVTSAPDEEAEALNTRVGRNGIPTMKGAKRLAEPMIIDPTADLELKFDLDPPSQLPLPLGKPREYK